MSNFPVWERIKIWFVRQYSECIRKRKKKKREDLCRIVPASQNLASDNVILSVCECASLSSQLWLATGRNKILSSLLLLFSPAHIAFALSRCRSTKTHPGPVVHLSDSPKDEGKVGELCRNKPATPFFFFFFLNTNSNDTTLLVFRLNKSAFLVPHFYFLICLLYSAPLFIVSYPGFSLWLMWR